MSGEEEQQEKIRRIISQIENCVTSRYQEIQNKILNIFTFFAFQISENTTLCLCPEVTGQTLPRARSQLVFFPRPLLQKQKSSKINSDENKE